MNHLIWKRRLLGALGAAALGLAGTAWAQESQLGQDMEQAGDQAQDTGQDISRGAQEAGEDATGGAREAGQDISQGTGDAIGGAGESGKAKERERAKEGTGGAGQRQDQEGLSEPVEKAAEAVENVAEGAERRAETLFEGRSASPELRVVGEVGVSNWAGNLGDALNTGPQWGVAVGTQVYNLLGVELGYNGQRNAIEEGLAPTNSAVFRHGFDLLAKVGPTLESGLRPYGGLGLGLAFVNPNASADPVIDNDLIAELPVAAGVDYDAGPLTAGLRGSWRWTYGEQFAEPLLGDDSEGSIFGASLTFGGRF